MPSYSEIESTVIEEVLAVNGPRLGMRSSDLDQHSDHYVPRACASGGHGADSLGVSWDAAQFLIAVGPRLKLGAHGLDQVPCLSRTYAQPNTKRVRRNRLLVSGTMLSVHFSCQLQELLWRTLLPR